MFPFAFFKRVGGGNRQLGAIRIKGKSRNRSWKLWQRCQLLLVPTIPNDDSSVTSPRAKCPKFWMKVNAVDGIDSITYSMAFERVFFLV